MKRRDATRSMSRLDALLDDARRAEPRSFVDGVEFVIGVMRSERLLLGGDPDAAARALDEALARLRSGSCRPVHPDGSGPDPSRRTNSAR